MDIHALAPFALWWGFAALLLIAELLIGSGFLLAMAFAAVITGFVVYYFPLTLVQQFIGFSLVESAAFLGWFLWFQVSNKNGNVSPFFLNQRMQRMVGQEALLLESVISRKSKIKIGDTVWQVECDEHLSEGESVVITGSRGPVLVVQKK